MAIKSHNTFFNRYDIPRECLKYNGNDLIFMEILSLRGSLSSIVPLSVWKDKRNVTEIATESQFWLCQFLEYSKNIGMRTIYGWVVNIWPPMVTKTGVFPRDELGNRFQIHMVSTNWLVTNPIRVALNKSALEVSPQQIKLNFPNT